jgi:hypothetical protein
LAGQCFADTGEIALATRAATGQLNQRARPWVWGRPATGATSSPTAFKEPSTR